MPRIMLAAITLIALTFAACSSGGGESDDPAEREDDLREAAPAVFKAIFSGDAPGAYAYFSSDFQDQCSLKDFTEVIAIASVFFGDVDQEDVEVTVTDVRFEGEKAYVTMEGSIDGEDLDLQSEEETAEYWILEDGEWKFTTTDDTGCDGEVNLGDDDADDDETPVTGPGSSRSEPQAVGKSVEVSDLRITLLEVDTNAAAQLEELTEFDQTPVPGRRVVLARIKVEHIGDADTDETIQVFESDFELTGSSNVIYDGFEEGSSCGFLEDTLGGEMFPGGTIEGYFCIQVPEDETDLLLIAAPGFGFDDGRRFFTLE